MPVERFPLGTKCEPDPITGLLVRQLTDLPDQQFYFPYFTNNPFPRPNQVICFGMPADVDTGQRAPKTLYVADLAAQELRQVTPPLESNNLWLALCGLVAAQEGDRAFWLLDDQVFMIDLAHGEHELVYESPPEWGMSQGNCTAAGDVFSVGETRRGFHHKDGYTTDAEAHAWPQQPVGRIILVDAAKAKGECVLGINGLPSHVNIHPHDRNLVMFDHEGQWSYLCHRVWLLDVASGEARKVCPPPEGYGIGHETWTEDGRIVFHGSTLCLRPEDRPPGPQPPEVCLIGVGRVDGTLDKVYFGQGMRPFPRGGLAHVIMSPDCQWIVTGGQWTRDFVSIARWGDEELKPRAIAAHYSSGSGVVGPRFFPDNQSIAFIGWRGDTHQLYCVDLPQDFLA